MITTTNKFSYYLFFLGRIRVTTSILVGDGKISNIIVVIIWERAVTAVRTDRQSAS
jgi:hypothetical protein